MNGGIVLPEKKIISIMRMRKFKEVALRENGIAFIPQSAIFYITYKCNLNCSYCFQRKQHKEMLDTYYELSLDEIKKIFSGISFKSLFLTGGEIFLRKDIADLIIFFSNKVEKLSLFTNGTLLKDDDIELIRSLNNVDVWFSLDGIDDINDFNRGKETFRKIWDNIKKLAGKDIYINCVITEKNIDHLAEFYDFANENGICKITFQFPMWYEECTDFSSKYGFDYYPGMQGDFDFNFILKLNTQIELIKTAANNHTEYRFYPQLFCENIKEYIDGSIREKKQLTCGDIVNSKLKILPNGDVVICEAFRTKIGNMLSEQLEIIWNNEKAKKIRKTLLNSNLTEMCSRCCSLECSYKGDF